MKQTYEILYMAISDELNYVYEPCITGKAIFGTDISKAFQFKPGAASYYKNCVMNTGRFWQVETKEFKGAKSGAGPAPDWKSGLPDKGSEGSIPSRSGFSLKRWLKKLFF